MPQDDQLKRCGQIEGRAMTTVLRLLGILLGLSLSAPDTANSQTSKGGRGHPSPAAVAIGKSDFDNNCAACHPSVSGQNGFGPGLYGVVGRKSGTEMGYVFSPSYVEAGAKGVIWTESNLFRFLADPTAFLTQKTGHPAVTRMIGGFPDEKLRRSVILYLKTLK
jgi:cytochrome c